jgi:hypothetical protein
VLLGTGPRSQTTARTISQTTAKVVLIGDTGVGRSAMAEAAKTGMQKITSARVAKGKTERGGYDVFLSHNSKDRAVVEDDRRHETGADRHTLGENLTVFFGAFRGLLRTGESWSPKSTLIPGRSVW